MLQVTTGWRKAHPGASVGLLAMGNVANPELDERLEVRKCELEKRLRAQYNTREQLMACEPVGAYRDYYKRFGKTYPVLLQMESVAIKGKPFPRAATLVEAMFMAEVKNGLLTAGHDLERVKGPLVLDVAADGESYTGIGGKEQVTKDGDMLMRDRTGIIACVLCGPDFRTRITAATSQALFVVYAPPGVERRLIDQHMDDILANVLLLAPAATNEFRKIFG